MFWKAKMDFKFEKHIWWFFPLLSLAVFFPTYKYGYVTDFLSWLYKYERGSWADIIDCFDYPGLHQFFHLVNFSVFKLVGKSFFGWYLVMSFLHGINGALIYIWLKKMNNSFQLGLTKGFYVFVVFCFMLSPYAVEPVVWKACLHYLLSLGLIVGGLIYLTDSFDRPKLIWKSHFCFLLALLTLEISLAVPFIYLAYWLTYGCSIKGEKLRWARLFISRSLIPFVIIILYFLANKFLIGDWVGHYGAESHLNFDFDLMSSNAFMYLFKYGFFLHYLPFKYKSVAYTFIAQPWLVYSLIVISLGIGAWIFVLFRKGKTKFLSVAFAYLAFFMALFPISNLFFFSAQIYENDRYGYLASLFFYLFLGLLFWMIPHKWIRNSLIFLFLTGLFYCSFKTLKMANYAGHLTHAMVDNFDYYESKEIVFLSKYDNFGGLQMFRDLSGKAQAFTESLYHFDGKIYNGKIYDLVQINTVGPGTKASVEVLDSVTLKVRNLNPGSWFWRDGMGLSSYETDDFKVKTGQYHYLLSIKDPNLERTYLYNVGEEWKEVDFSKKGIQE